MENQPTSTDGASIHDRIMGAVFPESIPDKSQTEEDQEDAQATLELESDSDGEDQEVNAELQDETSEEEAGTESSDESNESESEYALSDIAQLTGIDERFLSVGEEGELLVRTKVDGVEGTAKLNDLLTSYQLKGHLDNQNQKAVEMQKQLEAEKTQLQQQAQAKFQQADDYLQLAYNQLSQEYNSVNWEELRTDDPAEWSAKQRDFESRNAQIQGAYQQIQMERQQAQNEYFHAVAEAQQKSNEILTNGETIKGWDKPEIAAKEFQQVMDYGQKQGYSAEQLKSIQSHMDVVTLYKAMKYDELQQKLPEVQNKVRKAPKLVKPGQAVSKQEMQSREIKAARKRIQSGETGSVAEFLLKTGKV